MDGEGPLGRCGWGVPREGGEGGATTGQPGLGLRKCFELRAGLLLGESLLYSGGPCFLGQN